MTIHNFAVTIVCSVLFSPQLYAQVSAASPAATPATVAATASPSSAISATPSAPTACPAAFGIFGPLNASSSAAAASSSSSSPIPASGVTVQQTNNAAGSKTSTPKSPASSPPEGITAVFSLAKGSLNAADVATALQGKIPGVIALTALGPDKILYTIDPSKVTAPPARAPLPSQVKRKKPTLESQAQAIEDQLKLALGALPGDPITPEVLNLPVGFQGACSIITMVAHQVPGIVSLAALSDNRILVGYLKPATPTKTGENSPLSTLKDLVNKLAVSSSPPAPTVQSVTMRLYYDRDAVSVASVVQTAFSQLRISSVSMNPANTYRDTVVLADPTGGGSSETLDQARRMIAQLDEPRAQVIVNAWSLQISRDQRARQDELVPQARRLAGGYNNALEGAVMLGWRYVNNVGSGTTDDTGKSLDLDPRFASYLCSSFTYKKADNAAAQMQTVAHGFCPQNDTLHYALGYSTLFGQEDPDLIQMLILVMATKNPLHTIQNTVDAMEGVGQPGYDKLRWPARDGDVPREPVSCQDVDKLFYDNQGKFLTAPREKTDGWRPFFKNAAAQIAPRFVAFNCTRAKLIALASSTGSTFTSSTVGQFRSAVADYLFQNKMKAEYPNDFEPFLYPASAATLDNVLTPVVEAFNEDLQALQQNLQQQLTANVSNDKHLHYTSNGLVSVKVVSGNQAMVETQSANYFAQNPTIKLEDFAKALAGDQGSAPSASGTVAATVPVLAGTLSSVTAAMAAYDSAKPAQVTAKVGSGLSLTVMPFTLSSSKGAELSVNVTYNENGAATISSDATQSNATDDLNSRVSEHEVNTLVRMDSLKFFEISTLQSVIARQRQPWKPIDPFFELPLLDNPGIIIYRRKPEVIYSQSVIFLEASIMPTAADLGQGLIYQSDSIEPGACGQTDVPKHVITAHSARDFCFDRIVGEDPLHEIMSYHKAMLAYFAGEYVDEDGNVQTPKYYKDLPTIP